MTICEKCGYFISLLDINPNLKNSLKAEQINKQACRGGIRTHTVSFPWGFRMFLMLKIKHRSFSMFITRMKKLREKNCRFAMYKWNKDTKINNVFGTQCRLYNITVITKILQHPVICFSRNFKDLDVHF